MCNKNSVRNNNNSADCERIAGTLDSHTRTAGLVSVPFKRVRTHATDRPVAVEIHQRNQRMRIAYDNNTGIINAVDELNYFIQC